MSIQCPYCGHLNPPDARFCEACGRPLVPATPQMQATTLKQSEHVIRASQCSGSPLPIPYYLKLVNGVIVGHMQMCVYGREDFEPFIPHEFTKFITRRTKGGQFTIYCNVIDVNTVVCYIRDDFSTNPTLLNGKPIRGLGAIQLNDGDIISPGGVVNVEFRYAVPINSQSVQQNQQNNRA